MAEDAPDPLEFMADAGDLPILLEDRDAVARLLDESHPDVLVNCSA